MASSIDDKLAYRISKVAALLDLGRSTTYELVANGTIPSVMIGNCRRVTAATVQALLDDRTTLERAGRPSMTVVPRRRVHHQKASAG